MTYLLWIATCIWIPALVLWMLARPGFRTGRATLALSVPIVFTFLLTEYFIVRYPMVLTDGKYLGVRMLGMPIEDFVFFFTYPLLVVPVIVLIEQLVGRRGK
jgi:lycopene cyclase domain-containing protein